SRPAGGSCAAAHTVVDAVGQRVFEAGDPDRAVGADPPGDLHADPVAREERRGWDLAATTSLHPVSVHRSSVPTSLRNRRPDGSPGSQNSPAPGDASD